MSVLPHDRLQRHIAETTRQTSAVLPLPKCIVLRVIYLRILLIFSMRVKRDMVWDIIGYGWTGEPY